jgi:hypothetical protein
LQRCDCDDSLLFYNGSWMDDDSDAEGDANEIAFSFENNDKGPATLLPVCPTTLFDNNGIPVSHRMERDAASISNGIWPGSNNIILLTCYVMCHPAGLEQLPVLCTGGRLPIAEEHSLLHLSGQMAFSSIQWRQFICSSVLCRSWVGNLLGILQNSTIIPIPDLLNSGIFIGFFFYDPKIFSHQFVTCSHCFGILSRHRFF